MARVSLASIRRISSPQNVSNFQKAGILGEVFCISKVTLGSLVWRGGKRRDREAGIGETEVGDRSPSSLGRASDGSGDSYPPC